jgi:hypothetical protein
MFKWSVFFLCLLNSLRFFAAGCYGASSFGNNFCGNREYPCNFNSGYVGPDFVVCKDKLIKGSKRLGEPDPHLEKKRCAHKRESSGKISSTEKKCEEIQSTRRQKLCKKYNSRKMQKLRRWMKEQKGESYLYGKPSQKLTKDFCNKKRKKKEIKVTRKKHFEIGDEHVLRPLNPQKPQGSIAYNDCSEEEYQDYVVVEEDSNFEEYSFAQSDFPCLPDLKQEEFEQVDAEEESNQSLSDSEQDDFEQVDAEINCWEHPEGLSRVKQK